MRKLIVTVVVLAAVLVVADRVTHAAAEREVAKRVAAASDLQEEPDVRIHGFPFLTQALRGQYRRIELTVRDVTVRDLDVRRLRVQLRGVEAPPRALLRRDISELRAGSVTGGALIPFAEVEDRLPGGMKAGPAGGNLRLAGSAMVLGRELPVTAVVEVGVDRQTLTFRPTRIEVAGRPAGPALRGRFTFTAPVGDLPMRLRPTDVEVTDGGVRIVATAENVAFGRLAGAGVTG